MRIPRYSCSCCCQRVRKRKFRPFWLSCTRVILSSVLFSLLTCSLRPHTSHPTEQHTIVQCFSFVTIPCPLIISVPYDNTCLVLSCSVGILFHPLPASCSLSCIAQPVDILQLCMEPLAWLIFMQLNCCTVPFFANHPMISCANLVIEHRTSDIECWLQRILTLFPFEFCLSA